jgi:PBSX family phage terminase large subunit
MQEVDIKLSNIIAPVYVPVHRKIRSDTSLTDTFWFKGGRGSAKSSFVAIEIVLGIMADPNANAVCFRKVGDTVRRSLLPTFEWAIEMLGASSLFRVTVSPPEIVHVRTGQKIVLSGLDDPKKLKSIKVKRGWWKFLWFEELSEFMGMAEIRSVRQSVQRGGDRFIEFASFNPPNDPQSWVNAEAEKNLPGRIVSHFNYVDVPRHWNGEKFWQEAEELKALDMMAYAHEYLGAAEGNNAAKVFAAKCTVQQFEPQPHWDGPYFGADWGFSNDPNTLVKLWLEPVGSRFRLYIEYAEFGHNVELDDIPDMWANVPGIERQYKIWADCARPETISHMKKKGFRVEAAKKWQGSVEDGVTVIKSFVGIVIHTRCKEMQAEARLYSYKVDRHTQEVTPDIVDAYNHGWDAVRYALSKFIQPHSKGRFAHVPSS